MIVVIWLNLVQVIYLLLIPVRSTAPSNNSSKIIVGYVHRVSPVKCNIRDTLDYIYFMLFHIKMCHFGWERSFSNSLIINELKSYQKLINSSRAWLHEQGWHRGESTRLPPMWPRLDSRTRRHKWVEFVLVLYSASRVFLRLLRFSPLEKTSIQLIPAGCKLCSKVTHGPYSGC